MEFVEAPAFTRHIGKYLDDDSYRELQLALAVEPEKGDVMPATGGFRKLRWRDLRRGKGSRGGLRIVYYYFQTERQIWLVTIYDKDEATDLTAAEKRALKDAIQTETGRRANPEQRRRRNR
jgi:hypothetical protein